MRDMSVLRSASLCEVCTIALVSLVAACTSETTSDPEPECRVDANCSGPHMVCDQIGGRVCACAAGYAKGAAGCAWVGVVKAPGFDAAHSPPGDFAAWVPDPGITFIDEVGSGQQDPGVMRWGGDPYFKQKRVRQGVRMPRYSRAEPLAGEVSYQEVRADPAVAFGTALTDVRFAATSHSDGNGAWPKVRFCLGAGAYAPESSIGTGVDMTLAMQPTNIALLGGVYDLDHFDVVPAMPGECPAPGEVTNGDAEDDGGWQFDRQNPETKLTDGVGENGSRGARLVIQGADPEPAVLVPLSIPRMTDEATPALSFFVRTSVGGTMRFSIDVFDIAVLVGHGGNEVHKFCLPAPLRGVATHLDGRLSLTVGGAARESVLDSAKLTQEPGCGTDPAIADPGFEASGDPPGGIHSGVAVVTGRANSGHAALELSVGATWTAKVVTPEAPGPDGPALSFYYMEQPSGASLRVTGMTSAPIRDNLWHRGVACLTRPQRGGHREVAFTLDVTGPDPLAPAYIDDLAMTTDPACPVE